MRELSSILELIGKNWLKDSIEYAVFTQKKKIILGQGTMNVLLMSNHSQVGHKAMDQTLLSCQGRKIEPIMGNTMHNKCMIFTLQPDYSISSLAEKRT